MTDPTSRRFPAAPPFVLALLTAALLAACGGGGTDGSVAEASSTPDPVAPSESVVLAADDTTPVAAAFAAGRAEEPADKPADDPAASDDPYRRSTPASDTSVAEGAAPYDDAQPLPASAEVGTKQALAASYRRVLWVDNRDADASDSNSGLQDRPLRTIGGAMKKLQPGDDVIVRPGIYREQIVVPTLDDATLPTRIRAQTARTVSVRGSDLVSGWRSIGGNRYEVDWPYAQPEQVFRGGVALKQIGGTVFGGYPLDPSNVLAGQHASEGGVWPGRVAGGVGQLVANSFTWDGANQRLVVQLATPINAGESFEVSRRRHVLQAESAKQLSIEGLDFQHSNTTQFYRQGAVKIAGSGNWLRNVLVKGMDGACVQIIGEDSGITGSTVRHCGQMGITGHGRRLTVADSRITNNNTRGFNKWWEAGGIKMTGPNGTHDSTFRNNVVAFNNGDGIWLDWKTTHNTISGNTTAYNNGFGIHYEASQDGTITGNRAYGNKGRGIHVLESSRTTVSGNAIFGNNIEGIAIVDGWRSAFDAVLKPYDNALTGNTIAWNDQATNHIQAVLPGAVFRPRSDYNAVYADDGLVRLAMGYMSSSNYPFEKLSWWINGTGLDAHSAMALRAMPSSLASALAARQILATDALPPELRSPGTD